MASWVDVGILLYDGYRENPRPNVVRTEMDSGPPKQQRRYDVTLRARPVTYRMTNAEYNTFKFWVLFNINDGTDWFDWTDPQDSTLKQARIIDGAYTATPVNPQLENWDIQFSLETYE